MNCPLCNPERITKWYDNIKSEYWLIFDCKTCCIPMLVLKRHTMQPTKAELNEAEEIRKNFFSNRKFRKNQRKIPNHLHWHLI